MYYKVKFKLPNQWFWRTINKVVGDAILTPNSRVFYTADGVRIEVPLTAIFKFDRTRHQIELQQEAAKAAESQKVTEN